MHQIDYQVLFSVFVPVTNPQLVSPSKDQPHDVYLNSELGAMAFLQTKMTDI